jgi:hypothetical protein
VWYCAVLSPSVFSTREGPFWREGILPFGVFVHQACCCCCGCWVVVDDVVAADVVVPWTMPSMDDAVDANDVAVVNEFPPCGR